MSTVAKVGSEERFRFLREAISNISLIVGLLIVLGIVVVVLFGPLFAPYNPYLVDRVVVDHFDFERDEYIRVPLNPGEENFTLGTNEIGQDMLSLLLHGARNTLIAAILIATARVLIGLFIGLFSGWFEGKWFDRVVQALTGVLTALPMLISGLILVFAIGIRHGMITFFLALTIVGWTEVAQYIRSEVLIARRMPYMEAARSIGLREIEIAIRHVIPNVLPQLFVISFLEMGAVLMLLGELALIGVFIGGGATIDFSDIMSPPSIVAIPSQPEWGAMIASGYRWFRSNPHIVLIPASAVFLAVFGFNAVGEGLRGLFEKRGIKASFILSRRMLGVIASVFLVTFLIFQSTQPRQWFRAMATNFNAENARLDREIINRFAAQNTGMDRPIPIAEYVAIQLDEYGGNGGVRWSNYFDVRKMYVYEPAWTPVLELQDGNGNRQQAFEYGTDFGYIIDQYGGQGKLSLPLLLLHYNPDLRLDAFQLANGVPGRGHIVMLQEGNAPVEVPRLLVERGASGIIWVAEPGVRIQDSRTKAAPDEGLDEEQLGVPVFRITYAAAQQILAAQDLSFDSLFPEIDPDSEAEAPPSREYIEADIQIKMELGLKAKKLIEVNNVVAYYQGTDADLGDEIIVFVLPCDGLWRSASILEEPAAYQARQCSAGLILEFMRMLNDHVIDVKRPIMVILWGGGEFSHLGLYEWLNDRDHFSHLSAPGMRLQPRPSIIIEVADDPNSAILAVNDRSQENALGDLLDESFRWAGVDMVERDSYVAIPLWVTNELLEFQGSISIEYDQAEFQQYGEGLSLALIRLLREPILNAD